MHFNYDHISPMQGIQIFGSIHNIQGCIILIQCKRPAAACIEASVWFAFGQSNSNGTQDSDRWRCWSFTLVTKLILWHTIRKGRYLAFQCSVIQANILLSNVKGQDMIAAQTCERKHELRINTISQIGTDRSTLGVNFF